MAAVLKTKCDAQLEQLKFVHCKTCNAIVQGQIINHADRSEQLFGRLWKKISETFLLLLFCCVQNYYISMQNWFIDFNVAFALFPFIFISFMPFLGGMGVSVLQMQKQTKAHKISMQPACVIYRFSVHTIQQSIKPNRY